MLVFTSFMRLNHHDVALLWSNPTSPHYPKVSAQMFFAHVIAYCPSSSLDCADTPPEPGTAFMVLATSSYGWIEATCTTLSAETKL